MLWINDIVEFESRLFWCFYGMIVFIIEGKSMVFKFLKGNEFGILFNVGFLFIMELVELFKKYFDGRVD